MALADIARFKNNHINDFIQEKNLGDLKNKTENRL